MHQTLFGVVILLVRIPLFSCFLTKGFTEAWPLYMGSSSQDGIDINQVTDCRSSMNHEKEGILTTSGPVEVKYIEFTNNQDPADGEPVLLLHGLLGQKRNWSSLGTTLAVQLQKKRRIFALDLRNHGDNTHDWRDQMSHGHMAHDVIRFMDQQGMDKVVVIGHSMGGKVAQILALQYPQRIAGLVVLDIAPVTYDPSLDSHWKAVETIIQALTQLKLNDKQGKTKKDLDMELRPTINDPALRAFALTNIEVVGTKPAALRWKINLDAIQRQLHVLASFDPYSFGDYNDLQRDENRQFTGDTYYILGGQSRFVRGTYIPTIAKYFPNYMMTTVKGAGHWVHSEAPDDTLLLLKRYLDR